MAGGQPHKIGAAAAHMGSSSEPDFGLAFHWLNKVRHDPKRTGCQFVELMMQHQTRVGMPALSDLGRKQRTQQRIFACVAHG